MKVLIVDDEPLAQDILENYISRVPSMTLLKRCNNAFEALVALREHEPDLMFLDIQMPQLSGLDFLRSLAKPPKVILTTAFQNYALESYELGVIDYLLKPFSFERFMKAVGKVNEEPAPQEAAEEAHPDFFFVKSDKKLVKVAYNDILYVEGLKDYVIIRLTVGRVITLQTMKSLEEKLPSAQFRRIHRSYIVHMGKIEALDGSMVEINKQQIPIGKNYKEELLELIGKNRL